MPTGNKKLSPFIVVFLIIASVFLLLAIFITVQRSYSYKLKSLEITLNSGPVSPDNGYTIDLTLTKDSCVFKKETIAIAGANNTTQNCQLNTDNFDEIQKAINSYGIIDKIQENSSSKPSLIGGKQLTITITLQDGTQFSTKGSTELINSIGPFLDQVGLYIPEIKQYY